ncbi:hypothetical protein HIM_06805 [Hirsutella minnesotensis 3608]|uniref:Peptide hydrolase n=1 Tax=Hirsutella minnesotensis 3608 TaxID=1043627 RepID=A0A0F7ZZB1_9HYPO|nr:hypothetical protein HIM_06805 [Hirsutella minnesotensis 3608]
MKICDGLLFACLLVGAAFGQNKLDPEQFAKEVSRQAIEKHVQSFNAIAEANGGNRAFGTPGYKESRDYVLRILRQCGEEMDVRLQEFTHSFNDNNFTLHGPDGQVPVLARLVGFGQGLHIENNAPLAALPDDDGRGCGCFEDQWTKVKTAGNIVLVQRGGCAISDKLTLAKRHGAVAVVLYNQSPGQAGAIAGEGDIGKHFPAGIFALSIGLEVGQEWAKRLKAGQQFPVSIVIKQRDEDRVSWNIIAESKTGDANNVVMLGAHLDSVQAGPGINDNGSGSSALIEIASKLCSHRGYKHKVRFAWWGAEELGLVGSKYYASQLSSAEADKIRFYFNYDMIGSVSPDWAVYADDDADRYGAKHLYDALTKTYTNVSMAEFGSSSDYVAMRRLGIPASGLFTGAGGDADPCYHQACDDKSNINFEAALAATRAAAFAMAELANNMDGLPGRNKGGGEDEDETA